MKHVKGWGRVWAESRPIQSTNEETFTVTHPRAVAALPSYLCSVHSVLAEVKTMTLAKSLDFGKKHRS